MPDSEAPKPTYEQLEAQVAALTEAGKVQRQNMISPLDYKYHDAKLAEYISGGAIWKACALVQFALMRGREHFSQATEKNVAEMQEAYERFRPWSADEIEGKIHHDQLAVLAELKGYVSQDTFDKMHPGTTSYDILDTARNYQLKKVAHEVVIPKALSLLKTLVDLAEEYKDQVQVGRTHLQWTSPITFGYSIAIYADRLAGRIDKLREAADDLQGKISGIVGTHASVGTVIGLENAREFERYVLEDLLNLKVCKHSTQVVSKEELADYANAFVTMEGVLADMSNTMRHLQASEIGEVSGRDTKERLGGSSADPSKNNPIQFENVAGVWEQVIAGMNVIYHMQVSDFQRDLRGSVQARYEPQTIVAIVYDSLKRMDKQMKDIAVDKSAMMRNLASANQFPAEAMNAILKAHNFENAHESVKGWARAAKKENKNLLQVAMGDDNFARFYATVLSDQERSYFSLENYTGLAVESTVEIVGRLRGKYSLN